MKWSDYDLKLREWCIKNNKPVPERPEAEYKVKWSQPVFNGQSFTAKRDYKDWGKNYQPLVKFEGCKDYWGAVRKKAAKHLDILCELY
jgi:hypothetical protein